MDAATKELFDAMAKRQDEMMKTMAEKHAEQQEQLILKLAALQKGELVEQEGEAAIVPKAAGPSHKDLAARIQEFVFNAEENLTFDKWYGRYEVIFTTDAATFSNAQKVCLLTEKLSTGDYNKFADAILPKSNASIDYQDAVKTLKMIFGRKESQFSLRYKCLKVSKESTESYAEYGARINRHCEKFEIAKLSPEGFKVLMFVKGLQPTEDNQALTKLLSKLDQQEVQPAVAARVDDEDADAEPAQAPDMTLQEAINLAERLKNLSGDKGMLSTSSLQAREVLATQVARQSNNRQKYGESSNATSQSCRSCSGNHPWYACPRRKCMLCPGEHLHKDCPYKDKTCDMCKTAGHAPNHCESAANIRRKREQRDMQNTRRPRQSLKVHSAQGNTRKFVEPMIAGKQLRQLLDSGSDWTIIPETSWHELGSPALVDCEEQAFSASGDPIGIIGKFQARVKLYNREAVGDIYVSSTTLNVLGSDWMTKLDLWSIPIEKVCNAISGESSILTQQLEHDFPEVFKHGLGLCNKMQASLKLKDGTVPIYRRARPVSFAAAEPIAEELKRLQLLGVITPITYAEYAAPIVVVKKANGKIRICADYSTGLNDALVPNKYPLPTPDAIFSKMSQFKVFSKIDLSDAFLQVELDSEAQKLLPINTHCGLFRVNRLQPGIKTAPGIFQQLIDTMMAGAEGTIPYMDDFVVGGIDEAQHKKNLYEALRRIQDFGFRLRIDKCSFGKKQISFLGSVIDCEGIRPGPEKKKTLQEIPPPVNLQQLQSFLGSVTWYAKFVPAMRSLRGPLDELLRDDNPFDWQPHHQQAFEKLREVMASDLALTHYDPAKKIIVAADASSYGMGAVIMHEMPDGTQRPIMHASSSFNKAEKEYPQIQREALALKFAVTKFHKFIYGRRFELHTDHQPLLAIFGSKDGIPVYTANRLQRYALTLLAYDFEVKYINTKSFAYADFISRLIANQDKPEEDVVIAATFQRGTLIAKNKSETLRVSKKVNAKESKDQPKSSAPVNTAKATEKNEIGPIPNVSQFNGIRFVEREDGVSKQERETDAQITCFAIDTARQLPVTFADLQDETSKCCTLKSLATYIESGWPSEHQIRDPDIAPFRKHRDFLITIEGCIFLGDRIVVPRKYREKILKTLHEGHPGANRMKMLARSQVYWPKIDNDIENQVRCCERCAISGPAPAKCTLQAWPVTSEPWSRIHADYAGPVNGFYYLVIVDSFSNWPEVFKLTSTTSQSTINCFEETIARHGIFCTLVTDNGPQFVSQQFNEFCATNGIDHITSAPYHPQSNGRAERFVGLLKTSLKKLEGEGNADQILRKFLMCYRFTPSFALGSKSPFELMTGGRKMKTKLDLLKPQAESASGRNEEMEAQYNSKHGAKWKSFEAGDEVFAFVHHGNDRKWTPGKVIKSIGSVNYEVLVQAPLGERIQKCHANQLKRRYAVMTPAANVLNDDFDIDLPTQREVEPEFIAVTAGGAEEVDDFQDALENQDEEIPAPRRTARANAGTLPQKFADYNMN